MAIFCQTKQIFAGRSSATLKKICEVWRKVGLFRPDCVPPNQLQMLYILLWKNSHGDIVACNFLQGANKCGGPDVVNIRVLQESFSDLLVGRYHGVF